MSKGIHPFFNPNGVFIGYVANVREMTTHEWEQLRPKSNPVVSMKILKGREQVHGTYMFDRSQGTLTEV